MIYEETERECYLQKDLTGIVIITRKRCERAKIKTKLDSRPPRARTRTGNTKTNAKTIAAACRKTFGATHFCRTERVEQQI